MIVVVLENSGNVSVRKEDYESPVQLEFREEARVLSAEVRTTKPPDIDVVVAVKDARSVEIMPLLLNRGDYIEEQVILSQFTKVSIGGRIEGVTRITKSRERIPTPWWLFSVPLAATAILTIVFYSLAQLPGMNTASAFAGFIIFVLIYIGTFKFAEWMVRTSDPSREEEK